MQLRPITVKKKLLTETDYGRCSKAEQEETGFKWEKLDMEQTNIVKNGNEHDYTKYYKVFFFK